jgi:hypothetical protein
MIFLDIFWLRVQKLNSLLYMFYPPHGDISSLNIPLTHVLQYHGLSITVTHLLDYRFGKSRTHGNVRFWGNLKEVKKRIEGKKRRKEVKQRSKGKK